MSVLDSEAFASRVPVGSAERESFLQRRDQLLADARPDELARLKQLAHWLSQARIHLFPKPNLLTQCAEYQTRARLMPWLNIPEPALWVKVLSKGAHAVYALERLLEQFQEARFLRLVSRVLRGADEEAVFFTYFALSALPVEIAAYGSEPLQEVLGRRAEEVLSRKPSDPFRLFSAVRRSLRIVHQAGVRVDPGRWFPDLSHSAWALLLEAATTDVHAACVLVDDNWKQREWSPVLSTLSLHGQPETAYRLAVAMRSHRPLFATELLRDAIQYAMWRLEKTDVQAAARSHNRVVSGSCRLLWGWLNDGVESDPLDRMLSLDRLLQYGDPNEPYWTELLSMAMETLRSLPPLECLKVLPLGLLARVAFYSGHGSPLACEGLELFRRCLTHSEGTPRSVHQIAQIVRDVTGAISVVEGTARLHGRNRWVPSDPKHPLIQVVADYLEVATSSILKHGAASALDGLTELMLATRSEILFRRMGERFRTEFALRVEASPTDAGLALQSLIQYKGYSQTDENMYRKVVCQDLFDVLLPSLDAVSAEDAAVARSGIGWSPRPRDL